MAEIDTSSYPKPQAQPSLLDTVGKLGAIEQQKISIDRSKLELVNRNYELLLRELNSLPPDATGDDLRRVGMNAVKQKLVTPDMYANFVSSIPNDPSKVKAFKEEAIAKALDTQSAINFHYGIPGVRTDQQADVPIVTSPKFGQRDTGPRQQRQLPVSTPVPTVSGEQFLGPQAPQIPEGMAPAGPGKYNPVAAPMAPQAPGPLPVGEINDPRIKGPSSNFGGNVLGAAVEAPTPNQIVQNRGITPAGPMASQPPMFEEGKKNLVADQQEASQRMMRIKPAAQALELMQKPGMLSGPLSEQFTQGAAALKTFGLIPQEMNDPTAIRQEVAKKLAQYVSGNPVGQRSDSAQILAEASSPNPKTQTINALIKLTKDAIVLDRVQTAMPNAFKDKDLSKYGSHKALFPQSIDERAFGLDMEKNRGSTLVDQMAERLKKNSKDTEANKFFKSLSIAKEQGFY